MTTDHKQKKSKNEVTFFSLFLIEITKETLHTVPEKPQHITTKILYKKK